MRTNYEVREYRGAGIEYTVFQGSHKECEQWLQANCYQDLEIMEDTDWVNNDPSCVNGNGFRFRYFIQVSFENEEV